MNSALDLLVEVRYCKIRARSERERELRNPREVSLGERAAEYLWFP